MKKSLIALAVLAASGAAMAQSSVTLYGIADVVIHKDKGASAALASGGVSGSRLGFKGTEDLGGGLKANFVLEQGLQLDTGAIGDGTAKTAGQAFSRQSYVGLSGGFGEVKLG
ncbi:MAG: porin, partial [Hydrogenophaga sp.]|nr:porin [Hydrogenophaga sp.]